MSQYNEITPTFFEKIKFKLEDLQKFLFTDIPDFFKNIWTFRKELWNHVDFDYESILLFLRRNLKLLRQSKYQDYEILEDKIKKLKKIDEAIFLLDRIIEDDYLPKAEDEVGKKIMRSHLNLPGMKVFDENTPKETIRNWNDKCHDHNQEIYEKAKEIENNDWQKLWDILKGPVNFDEYEELDNNGLPKLKNGSGLYKWWS